MYLAHQARSENDEFSEYNDKKEYDITHNSRLCEQPRVMDLGYESGSPVIALIEKVHLTFSSAFLVLRR